MNPTTDAPDNRTRFYSNLQQQGLTSLSQEEFYTKFSTPEKVQKLHGFLSENGLVKRDFKDFTSSLFPDLGAAPTSPSSPTPSLDTDAATPLPSDARGGASFQIDEATPLGLFKGVKKAYEEGVIPTMFDSFMRGGVKGIGDVFQGFNQLNSIIEKDPKLNEVGRAVGSKFRDYAQEVFPENEKLRDSYVATAIPEAIGGMIPLITSGLASSPLAVTTGMVQLAAQEYESAFAMTNDKDTAFNAYLAALPIGSLEAIPVGKMLNRINKTSKGRLSQSFSELVGDGKLRATGQTFMGGAEEAVQEVISSMAVNLSAKNIYDDTRQILDGVKESGEVGFSVGIILNAMGIGLRKARQSVDDKGRVKEIDESISLIDEQIKDVYALLPDAPKATPGGKNTDVQNYLRFTYEPMAKAKSEIRGVNPDERLDGTKFSDRWLRFKREWFSSQGLAPTAIFENNRIRESEIAAEYGEAEVISKKLFEEIDIAAGVTKMDKLRRVFGGTSTKIESGNVEIDGKQMNMMLLINQALRENITGSQVPDFYYGDTQGANTGNEVNNTAPKAFDLLPENVKPVVMKMRDHVDRLQRKLAEVGAVDQDYYAQVILPSMGVYLNRSYKIFDDPKFRKNIPIEVKNKAAQFILDNNQDLTPKEARRMVEDMIEATNDDIGKLFTSGKLGSKDLNIFTKRKDIAEPIRALYGEYQDPLVNYMKTVTKISQVVANQQFLTEIKGFGEGTLFFKENDSRRPEAGYNAKISADNTKSLAPLAGYYTTPTIKKVFEETLGDNPMGEIGRAYMSVNGVVKYGKTIGNVTTHMRNLMSGAMLTTASGYNPFNKEYRTKVFEIMSDPYKNMAEHKKLIALNIFDESVTSREIMESFNREDISHDDFLPKQMSRSARIKRKAKKGVEFVADVYQAEDNFLRASYFYQIRDQYRSRLKNLPDAEIDAMAARVVRDTYATYSMAPKAVDLVRKLPVIATFPSWAAEIIRTSKNNVLIAQKEIATPELRDLGYKRIASMIGAMSAPFAAAAASKMLNGISNDEDEDFRNFMPPWSKNNPILYLGKRKGQQQYIDIGYLDPWNTLRSPLLSMINGDDDRTVMQKLTSAVTGLLEPFVGEDILAQRILEVYSNKKDNGSQVYNEQADNGDKFADVLWHLYTAFEPGTVATGRRFTSAARGEINQYGKKFNMEDEAKALFGVRQSTVDIPTSLEFKAYNFNRDKQEAKRLYNKALYSRGRVSSSDLNRAYQDGNTAYMRVMNEFMKDIRSAYRLGVTESQIKGILKRGGWTKSEADQLLYGGIQPLEFKEKEVRN